jgi:hypothetical protein
VVLRSRYTIRRFFALFGAIASVSMLLTWLVSQQLASYPTLQLAATNTFSTLTATVVVLIATYGFYIFITPPGLREANILPLRSAEIAGEIIDLNKDVSDYWFFGR